VKPALSLYLLFLSIGLATAIVVVPLTIRIKMDNWRKNKSISLGVGFLFFTGHKRFTLKKFSLARQKLTSWFPLFREIAYLRTGLSFLNQQLKILNWKSLTFKIKVGSGDPANTALLAGGLMGTSRLVSRYLQEYYYFEKRPSILVYPSFTTRVLYFDLYLVFKTSIGRLLYIGIFLAAYLVAGRWLKNAGASNPRSHENSHGKFKGNGGC
jgi:hypothetical protein